LVKILGGLNCNIQGSTGILSLGITLFKYGIYRLRTDVDTKVRTKRYGVKTGNLVVPVTILMSDDKYTSVRFEVFMVVKIQVQYFCVTTQNLT